MFNNEIGDLEAGELLQPLKLLFDLKDIHLNLRGCMIGSVGVANLLKPLVYKN